MPTCRRQCMIDPAAKYHTSVYHSKRKPPPKISELSKSATFKQHELCVQKETFSKFSGNLYISTLDNQSGLVEFFQIFWNRFMIGAGRKLLFLGKFYNVVISSVTPRACITYSLLCNHHLTLKSTLNRVAVSLYLILAFSAQPPRRLISNPPLST